MMRVIMHVRTQTVRGEYVQARLKASSISIFDTAPPAPVWAADNFVGVRYSKVMNRRRNADSASGGRGSSSSQPPLSPTNQKQARKKKRTRSKKNKNKKLPSSPASSPEQLRQLSAKDGAQFEKPSPPSLGEDDFPSLQDKKVEWETTLPAYGDDDKDIDDNVKNNDEEDEEDDDDQDPTKSSNRSVSDVASTVTTSSSSMDWSSAAGKMSTTTLRGYAAALMLNPSRKPLQSAPTLPPRPYTLSDPSKVLAAAIQEPSLTTSATVTQIKPPKWGRGRSFADILRSETRA